MAEIKRSVDTLIEADEGAYSIYDVQRIINKRAADAILIKVGKAGGLYNAKKIAAVAESAGLQCVIGTGWGLGIKVASKLHLATSTLVRPAVEFSEIYMHDMLLAKPYDNLGMLEGHGPPLQDGCLPVPDGPGFGVELDENKVRKYITPDVP